MANCDGFSGREVVLFLSVSELQFGEIPDGGVEKKERKGEREVKRGGALEDMCSNPCPSRDHMP